MKKIFTLIILGVFCLNAINAEITWNLTDDGTLTISGTDMPDYNSNGAPWYSQRVNIKKVIIDNGVTNIGNYAFYICQYLTSVTIPNSVTSIGRNAFYGCSGLTSITIPNSVTGIGDETFYRCSSLTSLTIPNSVTSIGESAFSDCSGLISIIIPNSVTSIGKSAFAGCSGLTSLAIPNSVTSIGESAFYNCSGLTSITIPNSVTSIGNIAFSGCSGLTSIAIPNSVTSIGGGAFAGCSGLTSLTIPNSVTSVGSMAFSGCSGLTSFTIPNSVTSIENIGISSMSSLTSFTIPNSVTSIGNLTFCGCSGLISITIPNSVTSIGNMAFSCCSSLTSITIPNSVTSIGDGAFSECRSLTSLTIPSSVTSIGSQPFYACRGLTSITCEATTPPSCNYSCFMDFPNAFPVYVPANSVEKYKAADGWKELANIQAIDNQSIASTVIAKIDAIGKVEYTVACKGKIDEANNAYEALTADQKALVTNLGVLTTAKQTYDALKAAADKLAADKAKADVVIAKINAIGKVEYTYACKEKIDEANNAYNALTADQKALVTNLDVLTTAKQTYDNLKAEADKLAADKAAFDKYKSEIIAIIESLVKEDDSDAVKEIIKKAISEIEDLKYDDVISLDDNKAKINSFATSVDEAVEIQRAEDEKTNGIEELEFAEKVNIYDLNGRKITNSMLKSGLYIRNGKKVVVK